MNEHINPTERNRFSFGFYFGTIFFVILVDQVSKLFVKNPFQNFNFAFSLPVPVVFMYLIYLVVLVAIVLFLKKQFSTLRTSQKIAWSLILGGAISNIGERIVLGYVRDFIPLLDGILNIADLVILAGIAILLYNDFFVRKVKDSTQSSDESRL